MVIHWPANGAMPQCTVNAAVHNDPPGDEFACMEKYLLRHLAMIGDAECRNAFRSTAVIVCEDEQSAWETIRLACEYGHGGVH